MTTMRRHFRLGPISAAVALLASAGCKDFLDVKPVTEVAGSAAISDLRSAQAAAAGMYDELQNTSYYGGDFTLFMDLSGPDVIHTGTFTSYADADDNNLTADNGSVDGIWAAAYRAIGRANTIIAKVPGIASIDASSRDAVLGQAYFVRALAYHDLVKVFGQPLGGLGVPIRTKPPVTIEETFAVTRSTTAEVYALILSDLAAAEPLLAGTSDRHKATVTAVRALRARVQLYMKDYAGALVSARQVLATSGYSLAPNYADLFTAGVSTTPENIFQLSFTAADASNLGYYYISKPLGGRREVAPSVSYSTSFPAGDARKTVTAKPRTSAATSYYGAKFPSPAGDDDFHVIRLAEVILIKAEAHAQLAQLDSAAIEVNKIRVRAKLAPVTVPFPDVATAMTEIIAQRRWEFGLEGQRWPDLVRLGIAATSYGTQALYPIPQGEIDVTAKGSLVQNPGY